VKLCRFELKSTPGDVKSGIVYSGKVYETDGANAIAVHEAEEIRPLSPVGQPPAIRVFRCLPGLIDADETPAYFYGSPAALTGASPIIPKPEFVAELDYEPYVVAVIAAEAVNVPVEDADDLILGYSLMNVLVARDVERHEKRAGSGPGRSYDLGIPIGPVLTTPDELEDSVETAEKGRRFKLAAVSRVNGVEKRRGNLVDLPFTFAQAISVASETSHLKTGDLFALGPIAFEDSADWLTPGDEVQLAVEKLGTLAFRIG
jgi:2-keto-4-pentenoate hydratase/2-oxohepta-3-ene-1,7-dioic acid hydratase in catechol pathway